MFVRVKKIKEREYAYLVENEWTPWGSRQRVKKYIGKACKIERIAEETEKLPKGFKDAILTAAMQELKNHGFKEQEGKLKKDNMIFSINERKVIENGKNIALSLNEGYFCEETLKQLLSYTLEERPDTSAKKLAILALETGLKLTNEQFIHLFEEAKNINNKNTTR